MHDRPVDQRIHDFAEVDAGLTPEEAIAEAERCLQCKKPLCVKGCPVNIDIPSFIREVAAGDFKKAAVIIREQNMLPPSAGGSARRKSSVRGHASLETRIYRFPLEPSNDLFQTGNGRMEPLFPRKKPQQAGGWP